MRTRSTAFGLTDLLLLLTIGLWAINFTVVKNVISGDLPPVAFTALRFTLAALGMLVNATIGKRLGERLIGAIASLAVIASFIVSVLLFLQLAGLPAEQRAAGRDVVRRLRPADVAHRTEQHARQECRWHDRFSFLNSPGNATGG